MILIRMKSEFGTTSHKLDVLTDTCIGFNGGDAIVIVFGTGETRIIPIVEIRSFVPIDNDPWQAGKDIAEAIIAGK